MNSDESRSPRGRCLNREQSSVITGTTPRRASRAGATLRTAPFSQSPGCLHASSTSPSRSACRPHAQIMDRAPNGNRRRDFRGPRALQPRDAVEFAPKRTLRAHGSRCRHEPKEVELRDDDRARRDHGLLRVRDAADGGGPAAEATSDVVAGKAREARPATRPLVHAASASETVTARVVNGSVQSSFMWPLTERRHSYLAPGASGIAP